MKKIMYTLLCEALTENEYVWAESSEAEFGRDWGGDVEGSTWQTPTLISTNTAWQGAGTPFIISRKEPLSLKRMESQ